MCGIVGLFLKDQRLEPELGALLAGMLGTLCDRGPDSAGFAVYGEETPGRIKLTLRAPQAFDFEALLRRLAGVAGAPLTPMHPRHPRGHLSTGRKGARSARRAGARRRTSRSSAAGRRMEIFKEVGRPDRVAARFGLAHMAGTHAIGHTRMATESAVTTDGAHPFTTGAGPVPGAQWLAVEPQRGAPRARARAGMSFADRKRLRGRRGVHDLENASKARRCNRRWRPRSRRSTASIRSWSAPNPASACCAIPIACKPAVMAETERWVAFGTEYRALVDLPGSCRRQGVGARAGPGLFLGTALMPTVDLADDIAARAQRGPAPARSRYRPTCIGACSIRAASTRSQSGLTAPVTVEIDGHVGYYCAGMNKRATVVVHGNAGQGVAENMMSGEVHVEGDASQAAGATGCGGLLVIDGNAAARCGISMKGIDIVVKGSVGHLSAFMAQAGNLVVLGRCRRRARRFDLRGASLCARQCQESRRRLHRETAARSAQGGAAPAARCGGSGQPGRCRRVSPLWLGAPALSFPHRQCRIVLMSAPLDRWIHTPPRKSATFDDHAIAEIRRAAATGIYDIRGAGAKRKLPHFDDLLFLGASVSRYPLEGYREKCAHRGDHRHAPRQKADHAQDSHHHRGHELRLALRAGQGGARTRRQRGGHFDHDRRRRHDRGRARAFDDPRLSGAAVALWHEP